MESGSIILDMSQSARPLPMPISFRQFAPFLTLAALGGSLCDVTQLNADSGAPPFVEDAPVPDDDELDWPEADFPNAEARGRGFKAGERFEFRASWGIFRKAGEIIIFTEASDEPGSSNLKVFNETTSAGIIRNFYPMDLSATSIVDTEHWRMDSLVVDSRTRSEYSETLTDFDYEEGVMRHQDRVEPRKNRVRRIPYQYPLDYSSALLQLRGLAMKVGDVLPVLVNSKGKFYYVRLKVSAVEDVDSKFGRRSCFRIEPLDAYPESKLFRDKGSFVIWISDDAERIPLRFEVKTGAGTASVRLESYKLADSAGIAAAR